VIQPHPAASGHRQGLAGDPVHRRPPAGCRPREWGRRRKGRFPIAGVFPGCHKGKASAMVCPLGWARTSAPLRAGGSSAARPPVLGVLLGSERAGSTRGERHARPGDDGLVPVVDDDLDRRRAQIDPHEAAHAAIPPGPAGRRGSPAWPRPASRRSRRGGWPDGGPARADRPGAGRWSGRP